MKLMTCPINGRRAISEFAYGGELREMPDPARASDQVWADYVFNRSGVPGVKKEWWCHTPSGVWFIAERDTTTDEVLQTYLYRPSDSASKHGESQPAVSEHGS
jgi:sarcosine oxidase, subunit delta